MNTVNYGVCCAAAAALMLCTGFAWAAPPALVLATDASDTQVCPRNGSLFLVQHDLAKWLDDRNGLNIARTADPADNSGQSYFDPLRVLNVAESNFDNPVDHATLAALAATDTGRFLRSVVGPDLKTRLTPDEQVTALSAIGSLLASVDELLIMRKDPKNAFYGQPGDLGPASPNANQWLSQAAPDGPIAIVCNPPKQQPFVPGAVDKSPGILDALRVRGTADSLLVPRNSKTAFGGADKASISFSYDGTKKTQTDVVQATLGYSIPLGHDGEVVPYATISRNVANTKGAPPKFNTNFYDLGAVFKFEPSDAGWTYILSGRPHFLINELDHSRQFGFHFEGKPIVNAAFINKVSAGEDPDKVSYSLIFDLRGDADFYTDRGTTPATNLDYLRLGTRFGATVSIGPLNSDVTVTDTWMYGPTGTLKQLNDFQAAWTYNFDPKTKYFGLSVSYKIGRIEATGQPEQGWMIALTGKY